jgi:hypothetical protein
VLSFSKNAFKLAPFAIYNFKNIPGRQRLKGKANGEGGKGLRLTTAKYCGGPEFLDTPQLQIMI